MPYSFAFFIAAAIRTAPSSVEYSVWQCRWTKESADMPPIYACRMGHEGRNRESEFRSRGSRENQSTAYPLMCPRSFLVTGLRIRAASESSPPPTLPPASATVRSMSRKRRRRQGPRSAAIPRGPRCNGCTESRRHKRPSEENGGDRLKNSLPHLDELTHPTQLARATYGIAGRIQRSA